MMQLQSEVVTELFSAISKMQSQLGHAFKNAKNPHFKSDYANLESVIDAAKKPLADNGLAIIQSMMRIESELTLVTTLAHTSGQWIRSFTPIVATKQDAQGMGSGISYARRFAYAAVCGIAQTDDDGNAASDPSDANEVLKPRQLVNHAPGAASAPAVRTALRRAQNCEHCGKAMMVDRMNAGFFYCVPCKHRMPMKEGA